jgi:hypothetical protein
MSKVGSTGLVSTQWRCVMTGTVGFLLAVVAGWFVAERSQVVKVVVLPFLAILAVQTWSIGSGRGVSPPSTVTAFPSLIGYYVVQAIILALALGIALQISALRFSGRGSQAASTDKRSRTALALVVNGSACALVVAAFAFGHSVFDPGSVTHHRASGSPPVLGVVGIAVSAVLCAALGCVTLWRRRTRPIRNPTTA